MSLRLGKARLVRWITDGIITPHPLRRVKSQGGGSYTVFSAKNRPAKKERKKKEKCASVAQHLRAIRHISIGLFHEGDGGIKKINYSHGETLISPNFSIFLYFRHVR